MGKIGHLANTRKRGESGLQYQERARRQYIEEAVSEKKRSGRWLPKAEFERRTGRPGRKD